MDTPKNAAYIVSIFQTSLAEPLAEPKTGQSMSQQKNKNKAWNMKMNHYEGVHRS